MKFTTAVLAALALVRSATAQTCNVLTKGIQEFTYSKFEADDVVVYPEPGKLLDNGVVRLTKYDKSGGEASQMFVTKQYRIADGFQADFEFSINGTGDGIAFIAQNYQLSNTVYQVRNFLGFVNGVRNYIGVALLACPDGTTCSPQRAVLYKRVGDAQAVTIATKDLPSGLDLTSGVVKGQFAYLGDQQTAVVNLNGQEVIRGTVGDLVEIFGGSRFGWVGFSASTSYSITDYFLTATTEVKSLSLAVQPSDTTVTTELGKVVDWGTSYFFSLRKIDSCQQPVAFVDSSEVNITAVLYYVGSSNSNSSKNGELVEGQDFFMPAKIEWVKSDGSYSLRYDLPSFFEGVYSLAVSVDGVVAYGSPFENAVKTKQPDPPEGIPIWGLALLIALIVLIVLGLIYAIVRLRRYQQKLKKNKEDIEAGKEKRMLDMLEKDVSFKMNPMLGSLDDMKRKLKENEDELARLRNGRGDQFDDDHTIDELQKQNAALRDEMNKLKKEAQQTEAFSDFTPKMALGSTVKKKEFEQARA